MHTQCFDVYDLGCFDNAVGYDPCKSMSMYFTESLSPFELIHQLKKDECCQYHPMRGVTIWNPNIENCCPRPWLVSLWQHWAVIGQSWPQYGQHLLLVTASDRCELCECVENQFRAKAQLQREGASAHRAKTTLSVILHPLSVTHPQSRESWEYTGKCSEGYFWVHMKYLIAVHYCSLSVISRGCVMTECGRYLQELRPNQNCDSE